MTQAQLLKIKPKVSLKIVSKEEPQPEYQSQQTTMYNTKTDMKGSKKSLANTVPRQTGSPSKIAPHHLQGMKKSNQISLLQLHRRMTIIG